MTGIKRYANCPTVMSQKDTRRLCGVVWQRKAPYFSIANGYSISVTKADLDAL
jgi:hypothetical protein